MLLSGVPVRETPGQDHLEAWCIELTLGGVIMEEGAEDLMRRATALDRDARRALRVAAQTAITKMAKRQRRYRDAAALKARAVYIAQLIQQLHSDDELQVAGDVDYRAAHMARAQANSFGENWLARQVAV